MAVITLNRRKKEYDAGRTKYLESVGYKVIRFWNSQVEMDVEDVLCAIENVIKNM